MAKVKKGAKAKSKVQTGSKKPSKKAARKTAMKAARKTAPKSTGLKALSATDNDPMGCCTFTDSAGQIITRDMRRSQCSRISGSSFTVGVSCNG